VLIQYLPKILTFLIAVAAALVWSRRRGLPFLVLAAGCAAWFLSELLPLFDLTSPTLHAVSVYVGWAGLLTILAALLLMTRDEG
jgi:predicted membrane metal-binding protein